MHSTTDLLPSFLPLENGYQVGRFSGRQAGEDEEEEEEEKSQIQKTFEWSKVSPRKEGVATLIVLANRNVAAAVKAHWCRWHAQDDLGRILFSPPCLPESLLL
jgi:hypothetical protein